VLSGRVPVEGIELTPLALEAEEIFFRFSRHQEWEISELSMAKYTTLRGRGDDSLLTIPVFPSRSFRHSAIYIRADGPRDDCPALAGAVGSGARLRGRGIPGLSRPALEP